MIRHRPTMRVVAVALLTIAVGAGCSPTDDIGGTDVTRSPDSTIPATDNVSVNGTTLYVERRGTGAPLLLVHGGGEDAGMLTAQAEALAAAGYHVVTYDRRGTGRSGRQGWPGSGAEQHADDAAALLDELDLEPATIVGVSSGGVIALQLAARHGNVVERVVAWEPPAAGVVPGGAEATAAIMAPVEQYLADHPGDFVGAQAILLTAIVGFPVAVDDPAFAPARTNAEPMIRDEPTITLATFTADDLRRHDITIAGGDQPNEVIAAAAAELAALTGHDTVTVTGTHEVYLTDPSVLTAIVTSRRTPSG
jgi:pimeloyl-ACP methyl ester carboxylesterase